MDPVTHTLMGAVLARTGLNRRAAYATVAMMVAAEFPDIDTVWSFAGPVSGFKHHRGITHTLLGVPFEAALLVTAFWIFHNRRARRHTGASAGNSPERLFTTPQCAPVNWPALYGFILLALLSHLLLDWTNNYGLRPFFPFDAHWYAASLFFIFDPLMFLILFGALTLPLLFRLIGREIGAAAGRFVPRRWAIGALVSLALMSSLRAVEHARAVSLVKEEGIEVAGSGQARLPFKVQVSPDPFSPFRWHAAADAGSFLQLEEVDSRRNLVSLGDEHLDKVSQTAELEAAERSPLGQVYLDWSPMPALSVSLGENGSDTVVFFRDTRFMGDLPSLGQSGLPPLTGTVELDSRRRIVGQMMDGREQRTRVR